MASSWAESALSWWQDAGVDVIVGETPRDWLKPAPPAPLAPDAASAPLARSTPEALPETLDEFRIWLVESPDLPLASPSAPRIGPSGDPASGLMILVDMPSASDVTAGRLLSGEPGDLFDRMLKAIGRSRETIYLAPLSPVRTANGRLDAESAAALATIARHHVGLVGSQALLLFGDTCARALVGSAVAGARGKWHETQTKRGKIKTLVTIRPEKLLTQPALKKLAWDDLQMLM